MRIYWKLLVVWLMSQMLGFALPALPGVAEPEMLPCRAWEQTQSVNNAYDAGCRSPLAYDGELAVVAVARWSELDMLTQATPSYDCAPGFLFRKVDSHRAPPFGEGRFLAAKTAAGAGDEMVTVFRGVGGKHPGFQDAIQGKAIPFGGHADPALHNAFDTRSIFTSWTTDYQTAVRFGLADGPGGVVLRQSVPRSSLTLSPDKYLEFEVLRTGPVSGATPIILSP